MRCHEVRKHISEYIDRELRDTEARGVEEHLRECAGCQSIAGQTRDLVHSLHRIGTPAPPRDLFDSTMLAIDRAAEPELTILARRPFRLRPQFHGSFLRIVDGWAANYEFKLIAFSVGLVLSFFLFSGILASMRPMMTMTEFIPQTAENNGQTINFIAAAETNSLPRLSATGPLARDVSVILLDDMDGLVVVAEVTPDGRGSIVQVLSGANRDHTLGEIALALNKPRTFVPAFGRSGRPIASRVVMFFDRVDVLG